MEAEVALAEMMFNRDNIRRTFPTNSCVRVSLRGPALPSGDEREDVAIRMTASMSSFVGGASGIEEAVETDGDLESCK